MQNETTRLVALLGSINTGGNRIKMAELRDALAAQRFTNVSTVIASGNVLFDGDHAASDKYSSQIAEVLANQFRIETFAVVTTRQGLLDAIDESPFADSGADNLVHVQFLQAQPTAAQFAQLQADHAGRGPERMALGTGVLHVDFAGGVGSSKLTGPFMAKRLGCRGTARNIRSLRRIAEAMEG